MAVPLPLFDVRIMTLLGGGVKRIYNTLMREVTHYITVALSLSDSLLGDGILGGAAVAGAAVAMGVAALFAVGLLRKH